jgi:hypothetical protein
MNRWLMVKVAIAAGAAAGACVTAWAVWPSSTTVAPHARQYLDVSACLLTGPSGISPGTPGARAWNAMESASLASHVMVSYLPSSGPADVLTLLNTLVERRCGVIVVTGATSAEVAGSATANPGRHFVLVTTSTAAGSAAGSAAVPPNAVVVPVADASGRIDQEIGALAGAA